MIVKGPGESAARGRGRYRCFLPDLAEFTTSRCTEPGAQIPILARGLAGSRGDAEGP